MRLPRQAWRQVVAPIGALVVIAVLLPGFGLAQEPAEVAPAGWDVFSDTWVATDGLGRALPTHAEVGSPRADRTVGIFPTWATRGSGLTLALYRDGPGGALLARRRSDNVVDNAWFMLELDSALVSGTYYLEASEPRGKVGWWSCAEDVLAGGQAHVDGEPASGDRTLRFDLHDKQDWEIRRFFTFRKPQPDYFAGPTGPEQWGWLEVYPQHVFYKVPGIAEQVTVGTAQNAVDGRLGVLNHPRSQGRSFQRGRQPGPEGQDTSGKNFAEQWQRALEVDPRFIFITGWNEWIAGRLDQSFPLHGSGPVTFCDQFNQEYSRDIEPMRGGHGDNYYYQMIAAIRRYKGVRPAAPVTARAIDVDGRFDDWQGVAPEFRDTIGDPVSRDHPGWGQQLRYVNQTGRNDLVAAKVSCDELHVYFYVRTVQPRLPQNDPSGTLLLVDADGNPGTGWLGYDVIVNRAALSDGWVSVGRNVEGQYQWDSPARVACRAAGNELELAIPYSLLSRETLPVTIDFKWADNIRQTGEWSDFTLNGDVAPSDRFNYQAHLPASTQSKADQ